MQPTHQSHFTVQQSSKFSQPGQWFSFLVWQYNNHKFAQEVTSLLPWFLKYCVYVFVEVWLYTCMYTQLAAEWKRLQREKERPWIVDILLGARLHHSGRLWHMVWICRETDKPIEPDSPGAECVVQHIQGLTENLMRVCDDKSPEQ